jgi:hypothetical protein
MTLQTLGQMDEAAAALREAVERAPRECPADVQVRARYRRKRTAEVRRTTHEQRYAIPNDTGQAAARR